MNRKSIVNDRDQFESSHDVIVHNDNRTFFNRWSKDPSISKMTDRGGTYYTQSPRVIHNYDLLKNSDNSEPDRKMLKVTVSDYTQMDSLVKYTLCTEYLEGKRWNIYKSFQQIQHHRKRVCKEYPNLPLPILSSGASTNNQITLDKRKYEIQAYLNYLVRSKVAYKKLLDLIEFNKNTGSSMMHPDATDQESSDFTEEVKYEDLRNSSTSFLTINHDDESIRILGNSFRNQDTLFDNIHDDRDDYDNDL